MVPEKNQYISVSSLFFKYFQIRRDHIVDDSLFKLELIAAQQAHDLRQGSKSPDDLYSCNTNFC